MNILKIGSYSFVHNMILALHCPQFYQAAIHIAVQYWHTSATSFHEYKSSFVYISDEYPIAKHNGHCQSVRRCLKWSFKIIISLLPQTNDVLVLWLHLPADISESLIYYS